MPTPFTHLRLVAPLVEAAADWFSPAVAHLLAVHRGPFLLGSTAPDVRTIRPIRRWETHFYPIPPDPRRPSLRTMVERWPSLAHPSELAPEQASFVAGYVAHLWFDEFWHLNVITPYYLAEADWGSHHQRFDVYNVLLGYLDRRDKNHLDGAVSVALQAARPAGWLPFASDADLVAWRDYLVEQLRPGAPTHTTRILARRAHMAPADFDALIADERRMQAEVMNHTPPETVEWAYAQARQGSAGIVQAYLGEMQR